MADVDRPVSLYKISSGNLRQRESRLTARGGKF